MPITLPIGSIINSVPAMQELAQLPLPARTAFKVQRVMGKMDAELATIEKSRKALIEKFAEKAADGQPIVENNRYKILDPTAFNEEMQALLSTTIDIDVTKLRIEDIIGNVKPATLATVAWLFEE